MAAAATAAAATGTLLPHALLNHRSPPPPQLLALSSSFRRLSLSASHRRTTHLVAHADAGTAEPEPVAEPAPEGESVVASADSEEGEAEGAVALAEDEEEPAPRPKPIKFGEIIGILNKQFIEEAEKVKVLPDLKPGDIIELRMQRPNKRRLSLFKGIIIAKHKSGVHTTIRVRRIIAGVGVEITFPIYLLGLYIPLQILTKDQGDQSNQTQEGEEGKVVLPEVQASPFLNLQKGKANPFISLFLPPRPSTLPPHFSSESLLVVDFRFRPVPAFLPEDKGSGVAMVGGTLISVYPDDLTFLFELDKPCYCNLKVVNNSEHHVAFKVKTTSPRKYFVRPNASVVQPWDSCTITITLQAQKEYPPDMQSKDKFLIQSTRVAASTDMDEIPPDTFNKDGDKVIEEMKLKVVYTLPSGSSDDSGVTSSANRSFKQGGDDLSMLKNASIEEIQTIQRLKDERDNNLQQNQQMQRELDMLRRRRSRKGDAGFSLTFAAFAGIIGLLVGLLMSLIFSSPPATA
ncbi:hypothetical protein ZWY2020_021348 [Hordeum vulgare]|nr:hypothetical protein ZWY2020_021348 [Hordeum vulgare]